MEIDEKFNENDNLMPQSSAVCEESNKVSNKMVANNQDSTVAIDATEQMSRTVDRVADGDDIDIKDVEVVNKDESNSNKNFDNQQKTREVTANILRENSDEISSHDCTKKSKDFSSEPGMSDIKITKSEMDTISFIYEQDEDDNGDDSAEADGGNIDDDEEDEHTSNYGTEDDSRDVQDDPEEISEEESDINKSANDDVALVLDSSDEDIEEVSPDIPRRDATARGAIRRDSDSVDDITFDDSDEDDLMDFAVMKTEKKTMNGKSKTYYKQKVMNLPRRNVSKKVKPKMRFDFRLNRKKRSIKWLMSKRMHHVGESNSATDLRSFQCSTPSNTLNARSAKKKLSQPADFCFSIDIEDSPEKSPEATVLPNQSKNAELLKTNASVNRELILDANEVVQIDSDRDISETSEFREETQNKTIPDEQNKENIETNDNVIPEGLQKSICKLEEPMTKELPVTEGNEKVKNQDSDEALQTLMEVEQHDEHNFFANSGISEEKTDVNVKEEMCSDEVNATSEKMELFEKENEDTKATEMKAAEKETDDNSNKPEIETLDSNKSSAKRSRSASFDANIDEIHPIKKLRAELETNFSTHDRIVADYIDKTSNNSVDEIQRHLNQLVIEIQTLNDMIRAKEIEWNNILHLKKVKEEICFRLTRKKQVMEIMSTKVGEVSPGNTTLNDKPNDFTHQQNKSMKLIASTPNISGVAANMNPSVHNSLSNTSGINSCNLQSLYNNNTNTTATIANNVSIGSSTAQSILQNRANMKSSDLAKEKANAQKYHRNILPKPSSPSTVFGGTSTSTAATTTSASIPISSHTISSTYSISSTSSLAPTTGGTISIPLSFNNGCGIGIVNSTSSNSQQPILNSYLTAASVQQQLGEILNGHHNSQMNTHPINNANGNQTLSVGRQGVIKDVKSIIADYRQRHPEVVPRRGRRMKTGVLGTLTQGEYNSILGNALKNEGKLGNSELGVLLTKFDGNSRPSSNDSSHSMTNAIGGNNSTSNLGVSFKDVLVQFAKMSGQAERLNVLGNSKLTTTATTNTTQSASHSYPEVTLHPVSTTQSSSDQTTGSLLHGILTKYTRPNATSTPTVTAASSTQNSAVANYSNTFSPTLARLLTAPERISSSHNNQTSNLSIYNTYQSSVSSGAGGPGLNLSKVVGGHNSEITITPVMASQPLQQTLLQQQIQQQQIKDATTSATAMAAAIKDRARTESCLNIDDEADDSVDRLVIDEGGDSSIGAEEHHRIAPHAIGQEFHENEVPLCQGCKKQEAQFVCAGCGNQWYCSRECQVNAWDEHSEVCTG